MTAEPLIKRLRDGDPQSGDPMDRAGALVRAVEAPTSLSPEAEVRILRALRSRQRAGGDAWLPRLWLPAAAFLVVGASALAATAALGWLRVEPRPEIVPLASRAVPAPAPRQAAPRAVTPVPDPPVPVETARVRPVDAPVESGFVRAALAIDPQSPRYRVRVPAELARRGTTFSASLEICLGANGRVRHLKIISSDHPGLDRAITDAVLRWRYRPATRNGRPVASCLPVHYSHFVPANEP